jgi:hypothetical protein
MAAWTNIPSQAVHTAGFLKDAAISAMALNTAIKGSILAEPEVLSPVSAFGGNPADIRSVSGLPLPEAGRVDCLRRLNRMNINHLSLFPDLLGSAEHCNRSLRIPNYRLATGLLAVAQVIDVQRAPRVALAVRHARRGRRLGYKRGSATLVKTVDRTVHRFRYRDQKANVYRGFSTDF